jgi:hypothetical protein
LLLAELLQRVSTQLHNGPGAVAAPDGDHVEAFATLRAEKDAEIKLVKAKAKELLRAVRAENKELQDAVEKVAVADVAPENAELLQLRQVHETQVAELQQDCDALIEANALAKNEYKAASAEAAAAHAAAVEEAATVHAAVVAEKIEAVERVRSRAKEMVSGLTKENLELRAAVESASRLPLDVAALSSDTVEVLPGKNVPSDGFVQFLAGCQKMAAAIVEESRGQVSVLDDVLRRLHLEEDVWEM